MLLSIIIPVYNTEKYIEECLDSIISQKCCDYEIILVNDGSTDNSGIICDNYAKKSADITVHHQQNSGVSSARNKGITMANGRYIAFVDSDDLLDSCWMQTMAEHINKNGSDMISFLPRYHMAVGSPTDEGISSFLLSNRKDIADHFDDVYNVAVGSVCFSVYRSSVIKENNIFFDSDKGLNEETFFNLKLFEVINSFEYIAKVLYYYRIHSASSSNKGSSGIIDICVEKVEYYKKFLDKTGFKAVETPQQMLQKGVYLQFLQAAISTNSLSYRQRVLILKRIYQNVDYHRLLINYPDIYGAGVNLLICRISIRLKCPVIVALPCLIKQKFSKRR